MCYSECTSRAVALVRSFLFPVVKYFLTFLSIYLYFEVAILISDSSVH